MSNIEQSGSIPTLGIFNLKKAQQSQKVGIVFKNHQKRWAKITPENKKELYNPGDVMKFRMKGQGVDYINFDSSFLMMQVYVDAVTTHFLNGSYDMIYRQQTRSGAFNLEDVIEANRFLTFEFTGSVHGYHENHGFLDHFSQTSIGAASIDLPITKLTAIWVKVPFRTILDAGDYIPIYQLAETLDLIFTLNSTAKTLYSIANDYHVVDAYILADGLVATNNSVLDNSPYKFPSVAILNFVDQIGNLINYNEANTKGLRKTVTHDIKKTSLKKWVGGFFSDTPVVFENLSHPREYPLSLDVEAIEFSMGGILYPYINGLDSKQLLWTEVQRYFHLLENTISTIANRYLQYNTTWFRESTADNIGFYNNHFPAFFCACFDRLNQRNDIVSGLDTERNDVNITFKGLKGCIDGNGNILPIMYLISFYIYNIMVTILGGEIKIED